MCYPSLRKQLITKKPTSQEPPEISNSSNSSSTPSVKKSKLKEDNKVLLRDVSVLKEDFQKLKERIDQLEPQLRIASTP